MMKLESFSQTQSALLASKAALDRRLEQLELEETKEGAFNDITTSLLQIILGSVVPGL